MNAASGGSHLRKVLEKMKASERKLRKALATYGLTFVSVRYQYLVYRRLAGLYGRGRKLWRLHPVRYPRTDS